MSFKLFDADKWTDVKYDDTVDSRVNILSCKKDLLLFNLDYFAIMVKDKCLNGTQLELESYNKISGATSKLLKKPLDVCCRNILKGKSFFRTICLLDKSYVKYAKEIIDFCELNQEK